MRAPLALTVAASLLALALALTANVHSAAPDPPTNLLHTVYYFPSGSLMHKLSPDLESTPFLDVGYSGITGFAGNSQYLFWAINNGTIYRTSKVLPRVEVFILNAYANAGLYADETSLYFSTTKDMRKANIITATVDILAPSVESAKYTTFGKYQSWLISCATPKNSVSNNQIWKMPVAGGTAQPLVSGNSAYNCHDLAVDPSTGYSWWSATQSSANVCYSTNSGDQTGCINFLSGNMYPQVVSNSGSIMYLIAGTSKLIEAKAASPGSITMLNSVSLSSIYHATI
eukprot:TRINITY_DN4161_c0_g1_i1.p1 TRINITY_DN4161_c0_g1~~TRINITY_DN4161_c0_g1_i1.p1  ORF type:complete len:304 (+),score=82.24 TRINITY_DN4161_c0_g1_i1:56-913(+)